MRLKATVLLSLFSFTALPAFAVELDRVPTVPVAIEKAYLSRGFDSNDKVQFVITGTLPNTCLRLAGTETKVDPATGEVTVTQMAYVHTGNCIQMVVPFEQNVDLGILEDAKNYDVKDTTSAKSLGELPIAAAGVSSNGPDDFTYAPISDIFVETKMGAAPATVTLQGHFPNGCWRMKETRVIVESADVVTILPIMEHNGSGMCTQALRPFTVGVDIPTLNSGNYLMHVRSLNGRAIQKVFQVK